ncbi:unnamed protein product [Nippostrongylus brasiliensis]|uniref:Uncharacterized protein n=1 Tax=Nippostrongylus brasiliensis TaxID=27835 RepID=A0A0N4Y6M8_NIPBR|nr:unnamed protein product [Nippostrongylus brasiliensis]
MTGTYDSNYQTLDGIGDGVYGTDKKGGVVGELGGEGGDVDGVGGEGSDAKCRNKEAEVLQTSYVRQILLEFVRSADAP